MTGIELIAAERKRQIDVEGFDSQHDEQHGDGELLRAAICYATPVVIYTVEDFTNEVIQLTDPWPAGWERWDKRKKYGYVHDETIPDPCTYKLSERLDLLAKAGALIAAEIDRIKNQQHYEREAFDCCPDCGGKEYLEGPHGGLSINFKCAQCGSCFNDMGSFGVDRIRGDNA